MPAQIAALLLPCLLAAGQADRPAAEGPTAEAIAKAVRELGDDRFPVRERASRFLWEAGRAAEPALREAIRSDDAEVVARAQRILQRFKYGIYPDTPQEIVARITQYRYGDLNQKRAALKMLMQKGEVTTMLTLVETEPDEAVRLSITQSFRDDAQKIVPHLILAGETAKAEQLIELAATGSEGMRNYAVYLLHVGRLDAKIAELRKTLQQKPDTTRWRLLAYLLRAKGDVDAAQAAADEAGNAAMTLGLLLERGRWAELAEHQKTEAAKRSVQLSKPVESLGYLAAYQRLAGDAKQFDAALQALHKLAADKPEKGWHCAEALLINGRVEEAVELLRKDHRAAAFELLDAQLRLREALALEGVSDPGSLGLPWMAALGTAPPDDADTAAKREYLEQKAARFSGGLRVAGLLCRLGQQETAGPLFDELARRAQEDENLHLRAVCEAEYRAGLRDRALLHAAAAIGRQADRRVLASLFPKQTDVAQVWWEYFRAKSPEQPASESLALVEAMLRPSAQPPSLADDLRAAEERAKTLGAKDRAKWLVALGATCRTRGQKTRALAYFEQAAALVPSVASLTRVGDLLAEEGRWKEAADAYGRAWDSDKSHALALCLQGHAMVRSGEKKQGQRLMDMALLMPLANGNARYYLAKGLEDHGLEEEANRQWDLIVRTGQFGDWAGNEAARKLGNRFSGQDNLKAAAYWERLLLSCLKTSTGASKIGGYLKLSHLIHKARARGLLAAGKIDAALAEIELSRQAMPGSIGLAEDLVSELVKAGRKAEADALFAKVFAANEAVCKDFPKAATWLNNTAWLAARCDRNLDAALGYATRATELAPDKPGYLDTLAEVHYRRGNRDQAVKLAKRCLELAPEDVHYQEQLARFEKGEK